MMAEAPKADKSGEAGRVALSRLIIGILMTVAGLALSAASLFSIIMIAGLVAGPLIFLMGIIVAGHSLQRLVRIKKEQSAESFD